MSALASSLRRGRSIAPSSLAILGGYIAVAVAIPSVPDLARLGWLLVAALVLVFVARFDLATRRIPNALTYPAVVGSLLVASVLGAEAGTSALLGAVTGFATLYLFALISRGALGMGDVKLAAYVGALLGPLTLFVWLALAMVAASTVAIALLVVRRASRKDTLALGPFLSAAALLLLAAGYGVV